MAISMFSILNTGRQGVIAHQGALGVTGQNIANVNTPGYSRQRANLESLGTGGVKLASVDRLRDDFLVARLRESTSRLEATSSLATNLLHMESLMGETEDSGTSQTIRDFFGAMQNLTMHPGGNNERESVRSQARQMTVSFNNLSNQFKGVRQQLDSQVKQTIGKVNDMLSDIARLNKQLYELGVNENTMKTPDINQLLDQRDKMAEDLAAIVTVTVAKDQRGGLMIMAGGDVLVENMNARKLVPVADESNDGMVAVGFQDSSGRVRPLARALDGGTLGALIEARDTYAKDTLGQIDKLAAQMIRETNRQHRLGTGLDNVSGRDFFGGLSAWGAPGWQNRGGATLTSAAIIDEAALTFNDYEIRFTAPGTFDVVDTTSGATLSSGNAYTSGAAIDFGGLRVTLTDGASAPVAGDVFKVNGYGGTSERFRLSNAVAADVRAIAAGLSNAPGDNRNALALAGLREALTMGAPASQTFESFLDAARIKLSIAAEGADDARRDEEIMNQQVKSLAESTSGVSIDEEATSLIQYQRAFEASSRVIAATDQMLQTLLNILQ